MENKKNENCAEMKEFKPLKSFGPFEFGASIAEYLEQYDVVSVPEEFDEDVNWHSYRYPGDDGRIYVENEKIVSVSVHQSAIYQGKELIGLRRDEFEKVFNVAPSGPADKIEMPSGEDQLVFEYDDISLQAWFENGRLVTIFVSKNISSEE